LSFDMFSRAEATLFVPDGEAMAPALARTTHLGVGAHADDLEIMAIHGILACYARVDRWFCGAIVSDGAGSPQGSAPVEPATLREVRRGEQVRAATLGQYGAQVLLDHTSEQVKDARDDSVVEDLVALLRATRPEVVYTHALSDMHDTHVAVALRLVAACRALAPNERPARVLGCEVWRDLDWLAGADKVLLAADERPELQAALLAVFESQLAAKAYDRAALGRRAAHAAFSESHDVARHTGVVWAMDLGPLVTGDVAPGEYARSLVRRFEADVTARIARLSG
jgi:LmbE family N-acetylglucosaminyl deacetylase